MLEAVIYLSFEGSIVSRSNANLRDSVLEVNCLRFSSSGLLSPKIEGRCL